MSAQNYDPVSQGEANERVLLENARRRPKYLKHIVIGLVTALLVLLVPLVLAHKSHQPLWTSCGDSPTSARQRGCSFDLISFAWQTPECYDPSLVSEFAKRETWSFYTMPQGSESVPQEVALRGELNLWVNWNYHIVHCTFMWLRMHRAYEAGWIDAHLRSYNHTLHCQEMLLLKGVDDSVVSTNATVIYPVCESVRGRGGRTSSWWDSVYSV